MHSRMRWFLSAVLLTLTGACGRSSQAPVSEAPSETAVKQAESEPREKPSYCPNGENLELDVSTDTSSPIYDLAVAVKYHGTETIKGMLPCNKQLIRSRLVAVRDEKPYFKYNDYPGFHDPYTCKAMPRPYEIVPGGNGVLELSFSKFIALEKGSPRPPPGDYILVVTFGGCGEVQVTIPELEAP